MRLVAEMLSERSKQTYVQPTRVADLYLYAGDKDWALDWLEKAYEQHAPSMIYLKVERKSLHDDQRFQKLLRRMNFPK